MAQALAEAGAEVALVSRNLTECQTAAEEVLRATGKKTVALTGDVARSSEVDRLAREAQDRLGTIDILINNAGINIRGAAQELSESDWDAVIDINLKGPFLLARALGPGMANRGWGRIINLGSIMSVVALAGRAPYAASKAGILNLTKVLALEWATKGVTVNALCPGPFATEMNRPLLNDPEKYKAFVSKIPMGRWGEMHEIAGATLFLASDAASFVTGSALFIDGGWTAQ
jgi:NAD(P)-dependent dehydrogenase (short-subunit alcohol dehydrogenase family)